MSRQGELQCREGRAGAAEEVSFAGFVLDRMLMLLGSNDQESLNTTDKGILHDQTLTSSSARRGAGRMGDICFAALVRGSVVMFPNRGSLEAGGRHLAYEKLHFGTTMAW